MERAPAAGVSRRRLEEPMYTYTYVVTIVAADSSDASVEELASVSSDIEGSLMDDQTVTVDGVSAAVAGPDSIRMLVKITSDEDLAPEMQSKVAGAIAEVAEENGLELIGEITVQKAKVDSTGGLIASEGTESSIIRADDGDSTPPPSTDGPEDGTTEMEAPSQPGGATGEDEVESVEEIEVETESNEQATLLGLVVVAVMLAACCLFF